MSVVQQSSLTVDLAATVHNMLDAAVAVTTGRLHLSSPTRTRRRLVAGDPAAVSYFRYELARQIASALLWMDAQVIAVYQEQDVPEGEELAPAEATFGEPLHLLVRVEQQTPALRTILDALNEGLTQVIGDLLPQPVLGPRDYIQATVIDRQDSHLLRSRAHGYRPAPVLLASHDETHTDGSPV
jgi:hypothetical protein